MKIQTIQDLELFLKNKKQMLTPLEMEKVHALEHKFKLKFPDYYLHFLLSMGRGADQFMLGSSVFYDELELINEDIPLLIKENNLTPLSDNAFVFWMHQGYQMAYFVCNGISNPNVYYFSETEPKKGFRKVGQLITFFKLQAQDSGFELT